MRGSVSLFVGLVILSMSGARAHGEGADKRAPAFALRVHARAEAVRREGLAPHDASEDEALAALAESVAKRLGVLRLDGVEVKLVDSPDLSNHSYLLTNPEVFEHAVDFFGWQPVND